MGIVQGLVRDRLADEVVASMQAHRLIASKAAGLAELRHDPHLLARSFWRNVETGAGARTIIARPFRITALA